MIALCGVLAVNSIAIYYAVRRLRSRKKAQPVYQRAPRADKGTVEENVKLIVVPTKDSNSDEEGDFGCSKIPGSAYIMVGRSLKHEDKTI